MDDPSPRVELRPARVGDVDSIADVYLASRRAFLSFAPLAHDEPDVLYEFR